MVTPVLILGTAGLVIAQVIHDIGNEFASHGGCHVTTTDVNPVVGGVLPGGRRFRPVIAQQDNDLRIIRRSAAQEGDDDPVLTGQGLGGAGFPGDAVPVYLRVFPGAPYIIDHTFHIGKDQARGLLADHLADFLGLMVTHHVTVGIGHRLDDVGFHQVAAVDHGRQGSDHLDGSGGKPLAEGGGRLLGGGVDEVVLIPEVALHFPGQLNASGGGKAEVFPVLVELLAPQFLGNLDHGHVAGVHQSPAGSLGAVAAAVGAAGWSSRRSP